ncbi:MAG: PAS domain-containing sensor histidine kinase, partial [Planctomycetota bacterium]
MTTERTADLSVTNKQLQEEIAERQQVEATLRESEERFRALFEQAPDSILQIDPNTGGFVRFNTRTHENLGYTREEFENLTIADLEVVESEEEVAKHIERILEAGSDTFETRHKAKDGTIRDVLVNSRIVSAHGQRLFQSIWTDITEHNRAEEALRDSAKRLAALAEEQQTLLRHTRDFLYRHDPQGVFDYLSPAVERVTGRTVDEWCRHYSTYMTDNPINQKVFAYTEETLRTGKQSPPYLVEIIHKDGRRIMLEVSEGAYFDEGKVAGIIGVARDVTDRIQAQEALRASEQRLQGILDNTTAVIYVKDQDGSYLLANRRFEELFHVSREEILGKTDYDFFSKDRADAFRANDKRVLKECRPVEFEEVVPQDDGLHTYISLKFPLYDSQNRPYAVCGISADITERQRARQALQEAKEAAEAASRAKSTFLANVSHEIRTPIMAMLGTAELMSQGGTDRPTPERLDVILRSGRHLLSLVEDLLDLSRAEQGKLEIRYTVCSPFEIMADVEAVIAPLQREGEVDFRVFYETEIPALIHT